MPGRITWTAAADAEIRRMREAGLSWDRIAAALGCSRNSALGRGLALLRGAAPPSPADPRRTPRPAEVTDRPPLSPGHPVAWGLLTDGTCLAGEPYPLPVFP